MKVATEHNKILALHAEWEEEINKFTAFYKNQDGMNERKAFLLAGQYQQKRKQLVMP